MRRHVVIAAAALLLAGCTTVTAPQPGLEPAEEAEVRQYWADSYWASTGLGDELRPVDSRVTTLSTDDWSDAYVKCMNIAGFDQYVSTGDGSFELTGETMDDRSAEELMADYVCGTSFEIEGQYDSLYGRDGLDYFFDYYQQMLVPCLELHGYEIADVPSRADFVENWGGWHPIFSVGDENQAAMFADRRILEDCPPMPPGALDAGFSDLWAGSS